MGRIVKASTALGTKLFERASNYEGYTLRDIYTSFSKEKQDAYDWCFEQYHRALNSNGFRIISHNGWHFSVAWLFDYVDPETGEVDRAVQIETPHNSYTVLLHK